VQLNRETEKRTDARPTVADAKQSGQIEQDCDDILYTYLDEKYNPSSPNKGLIEFGFLKRRNGLSGVKCTSAFNGRHSRIGNPKSILEIYPPQSPQQLQTTAQQYDPTLDEWEEI
jgi:replicative DNA helicase